MSNHSCEIQEIIQFILQYNTNINVEIYYTEISEKIDKINNTPINITDILFMVIDLFTESASSSVNLEYDNLVSLLDYIIKQIKLNNGAGSIKNQGGQTLVDKYNILIPILDPNSKLAQHIQRYIKSASMITNMLSLFSMGHNTHQPPPITLDELVQRIVQLEHDVRELKLHNIH